MRTRSIRWSMARCGWLIGPICLLRQWRLCASLARGHDHVLVAPYPDLPHAVVATAWGLQLPVEDASDPRLPVFVARYEKGPQTPEPGAVCDGGTGTPIAN